MASKPLLCEPCLFIETEIEAVGFCSTCAECLCSKCVIDHKKTKVTRNHEVHNDSIPENVEFIREMNEMLACPVHKEMKISYRCKDHSTCMCTVCRVDTHRNCEHVLEIAKTEASKESVQENLNDIRLSAALLKERKEKNRNALYQSRADILREQEDIIEKAINALEELKIEFVKGTEERVQFAVFGIDNDIEVIQVVEQKAEKNAAILEAAKKYGGNENSKVIEHLIVNSSIKEKNLLEVINQRKDYKVLFVKNEECIQVSPLGTFSVTNDEESENKREHAVLEKTSDEVTDSETCSFNAENTTENTHCSPTSENEDTKIQEISVSVGTDKHLSLISGIAVLSNGGLVVIDHQNSNIKLLSADYTLVHALRLPGRPIRICSIGNDEVAVSFHRLMRINRYRVEGKTLFYDGGFPTMLFNHGIGFNGNHMVTLMSNEDFCCSHNAKRDTIVVELRNPFDGMIYDIISDFEVEGIRPWSLALNNTQALQFSQDGSMVIAERNRVISFDICVERLFILSKMVAIENDFYVGKGEDIKDTIENIAIDSESIFVCTSSGRVLQLSATDFSNNRVIRSDPEESYSSIAVDEKNGRLILGCKGKDEILVYKI